MKYEMAFDYELKGVERVTKETIDLAIEDKQAHTLIEKGELQKHEDVVYAMKEAHQKETDGLYAKIKFLDRRKEEAENKG